MHAKQQRMAVYLVQGLTCKAARCREVERDEGMVKLVKDIQGSDPMASALLVECRGRTPEALEVRPCSQSIGVLHVPHVSCHFADVLALVVVWSDLAQIM